MSCESRVEPRQHGEEPGAGQRQDTPHVRGDSQQTMYDPGQSDEEEKASLLNAGVKVMVLQHVNEAEMEKEKIKETQRRRRVTHRVKHTGGALPDTRRHNCIQRTTAEHKRAAVQQEVTFQFATSSDCSAYKLKKNPVHGLLKEETVWSMDRFNTYINETHATEESD
ncbi:uncharacterized protein ttll10 [Carassius gibelio]|uniref:uncharacterized protein ttll10 n=1 Tax=Carassius gibelio TaxID=101364 RepID=UPI0022795AE9|nr:uncharacterized protein ttll10 [Carassius gibelio]